MFFSVAVLTGDVIASSTIRNKERLLLLKSIKAINKEASQLMTDFKPELFQGDSFQGYTTKHVKECLRTSLYIIVRMISENFGLRISTGIGNATLTTGKSLTSDGTAFQLSGRNMEDLKKNDEIITVNIDNPLIQEEWQVHKASLNYLLKRCTAPQAAAVAQMLLKKTQQEAANILNVKQPAVQQRLQAAGWPVMQTIIERFESQF